MSADYWRDAARANDEETTRRLAQYQRLSEIAMQTFLYDFPGAPCALAPVGYPVGFHLQFGSALLSVSRADTLPDSNNKWRLASPNGQTASCSPSEGVAGLYRACLSLCPRSLFGEPQKPATSGNTGAKL